MIATEWTHKLHPELGLQFQPGFSFSFKKGGVPVQEQPGQTSQLHVESTYYCTFTLIFPAVLHPCTAALQCYCPWYQVPLTAVVALLWFCLQALQGLVLFNDIFQVCGLTQYSGQCLQAHVQNA